MPPSHLHDLLPFLMTCHDEQGMASAHDLWVVALGVVFQWWYRPFALLRLDVTQRHFKELLVFLVGCWEVKIAVETVLGDAVGLCFVIHIIPLRSGNQHGRHNIISCR